jgi:hypothetical protein
MFRSRAEAKGLTLVLELHPELEEIIVSDENKLKQILINLLGNAIKFTEKGGIMLNSRSVPNPESDDPMDLLLHVDVANKEKVSRCGMNGILNKPFKDFELYAMLEEVFGDIFIYREQSPIEDISEPMQADSLTPESLATLPRDLVENVIWAATMGHWDKLMSLIGELSTHAPEVARYRQYLANGFRYDAILDLLEKETEKPQ